MRDCRYSRPNLGIPNKNTASRIKWVPIFFTSHSCVRNCFHTWSSTCTTLFRRTDYPEAIFQYMPGTGKNYSFQTRLKMTVVHWLVHSRTEATLFQYISATCYAERVLSRNFSYWGCTKSGQVYRTTWNSLNRSTGSRGIETATVRHWDDWRGHSRA